MEKNAIESREYFPIRRFLARFTRFFFEHVEK